MELELKSYRGFIIKILFPFIILAPLALILIIVSVSCSLMDSKEGIWLIVYFAVLDFLLITGTILAKFYKGKIYIFSAEKIKVYKREKLLNEININDIETIVYHPFRWRYVITIFFGELMDGGAWKLHIKYKDGEKIALSCFGKKDVERLNAMFQGLISVV